jgi:cell division protein ZapB
MGVAASTNPVLKVIALVGLLVGAVVVIRACTRDPAPAGRGQSLELADTVARSELGAEGDTEEETLRTLIAEVRRLHDEYAALEADNEALREQNARLERMEDRLASRLEDGLQGTQMELERESERVERQGRDTESLLQTLERRLGELTPPAHERRRSIAAIFPWAWGSSRILRPRSLSGSIR